MTYINKTYSSRIHCAEYIRLAKDGNTHAQICAEFGISKECANNWKKRYPEFQDAVHVGTTQMQALEEKRLRIIAETGEGNATAQTFTMKSIFKDDYGEVKTIKNEFDFKGMPDDQLSRMIQSKLQSLPNLERQKLTQGLTIDDVEYIKLENE